MQRRLEYTDRRPNAGRPLRSAIGGVVILALAMTGCGWGYASKKFQGRKGKETVRIIQVDQVETPLDATMLHPEDPCAVRLFTVFLVEEGSRTIKDVSCKTGQTVSLSRKDIDNSQFRAFQAMNVPLGHWYLLVDPAHDDQIHKHVLTNAQLLRLNKRYAVSYHHRMPDSGFMIYTFNADTVTGTGNPSTVH